MFLGLEVERSCINLYYSTSPTNFSKVELACGVLMFFFSQANNKKSGWHWLFYILTTFYMKGQIFD
jgi:hypothetical protein